jgi:hypothetical protein
MNKFVAPLNALLARLAALPPRYHVLILLAVTVLSWGVLVLPLREDLSVVYRYWDGPMYILVAKTLYRIPWENPITDVYTWPPKTFAPFLLAYPLAIRAVASILGYPWGMICLTVLSSAGAAIVFYHMVRDLGLSEDPLGLSIWFLFVPYRWLVYRSVGATEPMFLALTMLSLWMFIRHRYVLSFLAAAVACVTRIQGLLLVPTYLLLILTDPEDNLVPKMLLFVGIVAIPSLLGLNFWLHDRAFGDPLAYFAVNNEMFRLSPFWKMLDFARYSPFLSGAMGSQLFLVLYAITLIGLVRLWSIDKNQVLFTYALFGFLFLTLISDEDLARFLIPIAPFTWILGFRDVWHDRKMAWAFPVVVALTYAYTWELLPTNTISPEVMRALLTWMP